MGEFFRLEKSDDRMVAGGRGEILSKGEDSTTRLQKIFEDADNFFTAFPKTQHESRLCENLPVHFHDPFYKLQRPFIDGLRSHFGIKPGHGFKVVVDDIRP